MLLLIRSIVEGILFGVTGWKVGKYKHSTKEIVNYKQCKKTCLFKTWCKGDKLNIENSTNHFCNDTRQNALAALTNLGHVTLFSLLGPPYHLTIQWVREITSLDSKLPDQTEVHIRIDLSYDTLAERNWSHSSRSLSQCSTLVRTLL